jgi:CDP-diacylglycerol--glycerol-3-phosphate 3-phosphatidyltransferase
MSKVWNLPNMLSMFRILLVIPMGFALWYEENMIAVMIGFLSGFTDNLDGYFARRMNQVTELGKMLDPLADKLLVGIIGVILLMQGKMPVWFAALFWGRDILLMLGGLWARKKLV